MPTVADVLRRYGGQYLERFGATMPGEHQKVLRAISACRTGELGTVLYACQSCGTIHVVGRSCGNRHCPTCQHEKTQAWLEKQTDRLLPCPYFLVTFTLPAELREFARRHQRVAYSALFGASSAALRTLAADPKFIGTDRLGFFGVLHTWGRTLEYHPHVHYVVPGGGIAEDGDRWLPSRTDFLVPVKALSILYRAKFRDILARRFASVGQPGGLAARLGGELASDRRWASIATLSGALCVPGRDWQPSRRLLRGRSGRLHLSSRRLEPTTEDDSRCHGIRPPLPPARLARGVPESPPLRLPEPQQRHRNRGRAMAGDVVQRGDLLAGCQLPPAVCCPACTTLPDLRRCDVRAGIYTAPATLRHELA